MRIDNITESRAYCRIELSADEVATLRKELRLVNKDASPGLLLLQITLNTVPPVFEATF